MVKLELLYALAWGLAAVAQVSGESCTKKCSAYAGNYCECGIIAPCDEDGGTCVVVDGETYCEGECTVAGWIIALIIIGCLMCYGCCGYCVWKHFANQAMAVRQQGGENTASGRNSNDAHALSHAHAHDTRTAHACAADGHTPRTHLGRARLVVGRKRRPTPC